MPSLKDATSTSTAGYIPVTASPQASLPPAIGLEPTLNTMIRCPLPPIFQASPDSLRQFYQGGKIPQTRLLSAVTTTINSGNSSGGSATVVTSVISGGGGVVPPPAPIVEKQAVITTTVLGPGAQFVGTLPNIGRSFQLLTVAANVAARIQIYGTKFAQTADLSRAIDTAPPAGTTQGIVTDVALDNAPFQWNFQDRVGANGDVPQNPVAYMTITNLSGAAVPITVTLQYVPIET